MVTHIQTFFNSLLGGALPELVCLLIGYALCFFVLRAFFKLFGYNTKLLDYTFYVTVAFMAISNLGGLEWNLLLS